MMSDTHIEIPEKTILVVDDTPANLRLLVGLLTERGYTVRPAPNGTLALGFARSTPPDLILLDIKMPGMDGYEVCKQLKADERTRDIPVIFISALDEAVDKVKGFEVGGVDYVTKPFQPEEVLARVGAHLALQRLQKRLQENNAQLQREITDRKQSEAALQQANDVLQQRTRELSHALEHLKATQHKLIQSEKMAALGQLVAGVAHEINTPVGVSVMGASFLETKTQEITEAYAAGTLQRPGLETYLHLAMESSSTILSNLKRAAGLIQHFKQVAVDQTSEEKRWFNLKDYLDGILLSFSPRYRKTKHTVIVNCPADLSLYSYPGALVQMITNLLENSMLHGFEEIEQGHITIEMKEQDGEILLRYSDDGKGMDQEQREKIFDPFFTTKRAQRRTGLGMHVVYNLVTQSLGGHIKCQSELGRGTTFFIQLPMKTG